MEGGVCGMFPWPLCSFLISWLGVVSNQTTNIWPPSQGQMESHSPPLNTGRSSNSLLTNRTGQKLQHKTSEARLEKVMVSACLVRTLVLGTQCHSAEALAV